GRRGDVGEIVGAGAAGGEAQLGAADAHGAGALGLDLAKLKIGAGGDARGAAAELVRPGGAAVELWGRGRAAGDAQTEHKTVLVGRDVEETLPTETKVVLGVGMFVRAGVGEEAFPAVERVLGVFPFFLLAEVVERRAVESRGGGCGGEGRGGAVVAAGGAASGKGPELAGGGEGGEKALEVFLLI